MTTVAAMLLACLGAAAQDPGAILLPDPLEKPDGELVQNPAEWAEQRKHLAETLLHWEYGHMPPVPVPEVRNVETVEHTFDKVPGKARLVTAELVFGPGDALVMKAGYWTADSFDGPHPTILAVEPVWWEAPFITSRIAPLLLEHGYVFAGFDHNALASYEDPNLRAALDAYPGYDWGVCAVAAWGCRVTMNWIAREAAVDAKQVALWSHSRRAKSIALAGALDERFAAVVPHMSGMAGTAAYGVRQKGAQQLEQLLERYWLTPRMYTFINREYAMPFDQHSLHALIAPRPMYVHVGREDLWGNPEGEIVAYRAARRVYAWLGAPDAIGIHIVPEDHVDPGSPHGRESWVTLIDFLDWQFKGGKPERSFALED